jgi:D-alanyl-D-alanine dipeptidase
MVRLMVRLVVSAFALLLFSCVTTPATVSSPLSSSQQLVLVTTADWTAVDGTMQRYERRSGTAWQAVGGAVPIVVGRTGLAWGKGVVSATAVRGPRKAEGDGKAPAGIYRLSRAFGFAAESPAHGIPYSQLTEVTECVDDSASQFYNRIVERDKVPAVDWKSSERMRGINAYRLGVVVEHNSAAIPRGGSCIFMHLWSGPAHGTTGCTAMDERPLESLVEWLDPAARPLLVQLPVAEYARMRTVWSLP